MRVTGCEILRLHLPFRSAFRHAAAERDASTPSSSCSRTRPATAASARSWREATSPGRAARPSHDGGAAARAGVVGREFETQEALVAFLLDQLEAERWPPALFGGFEAALINLFEQGAAWDTSAVLGPRRVSQPGTASPSAWRPPSSCGCGRARRALRRDGGQGQGWRRGRRG